MDDFEKNIRNNKQQFDNYTADKSKIWQQIEIGLDTSDKKVIPLRKFPLLKVAASMVFIASLVPITRIIMNSEVFSNQNNTAVHQELNDIDSYYEGLVSFQIQLVKNNAKLSSENKKEFLSYMNELDEEYLLLKQEMSKNLDNEYILEAIVKNYKKRIEIIENLLEQINNSKKTDTNEGYIL